MLVCKKAFYLNAEHVVDIEKDKKGSLLETHQNSLRFIKDFSEEFDLMDTYRQ